MANWTPLDFALYERRRSGGVSEPQSESPNAPSPVSAPKNTVSTDEEKLNKTEKAYLALLRALDCSWIGIQNVTLKLGHDCRYTPDFFVIDIDRRVIAYEVKGFFRDDAKVKIKVAARMFPWIEFQVVRKTKAGGWEHQTVKP